MLSCGYEKPPFRTSASRRRTGKARILLSLQKKRGQTMKWDFDKIIDRKGTDCVKHDRLGDVFGETDLIPLWVADMDFETPEPIVEAMRKRLDHKVFGYGIPPADYWESIRDWLRDRHGWQVQTEWMTYIPGIVKGIGMVINALLDERDKVVIQPPVYHPFRLVPSRNRREVVSNPLLPCPDGSYAMDFNNLEEVLKDPACRLLILSNPHNPAGIVWSRETLERLAALCHRHGVLVISDEIHCDMALFGHRHVPFATVSPEAAEISLTFGAPSKTFNIAGIVSSYVVVPDDQLRSRFFSWLKANEFDVPDIFAPVATVAAYRHCEPWRRAMVAYIEDNVRFVESFCRDRLPEIRPLRPQASFLVWLDCRGLGLDHGPLNDLFVRQARLALNDGEMFNPGGEGFMRLNIGCPRAVLQEALERLEQAVRTRSPR